MAAPPLSIARTSTHKCTTVIPGDHFSEIVPNSGHWVAHVSLANGATSEHSAGRSHFLTGCSDGHNTTQIEHFKVSSGGKPNDSATGGFTFYNEGPDGTLSPQEVHAGHSDARVHVSGTHGLTYQAVVPAGSSAAQTIYWKNHKYSAEEVAKIHAVAPIDKPFKAPETFETAKEKGVVLYRSNEADPCVAQRLFGQNPTEMAKLGRVTIENGKPTDGTYLKVPMRLHKEIDGHVERLKAAHEILSKTTTNPGMAVHVVGMKEKPDFVHVHIVHSTTSQSALPKAPAAPTEFSIGEGGDVSSHARATDWDLTPVGNTEMPTEPVPVVAGGGGLPDPDGGEDE